MDPLSHLYKSEGQKSPESCTDWVHTIVFHDLIKKPNQRPFRMANPIKSPILLLFAAWLNDLKLSGLILQAIDREGLTTQLYSVDTFLTRYNIFVSRFRT